LSGIGNPNRGFIEMKKFLKIILVSVLPFSAMSLPHTYPITESGKILAVASAKGKGTEEFRKGPYLIYRGNNANMVVLWQLHSTQSCTLEWGEDNSYSLGKAETEEYGKDHQHAYTIEGLKPGVKYYYRINTGVGKKTGSFYAAPSDQAKKLKFFAYGDVRSHPSTHNAVVKSMVSLYKADPEYQTFVVSTGDLVKYGAVESQWDNQFFNRDYENVLEMIANLPFISCAGNHELFYMNNRDSDLDLTLFKKYFPYPFVKNTYWSFDYGPAHFVILDQFAIDYKGDEMSQEQMRWVEQDLKSSDKLWKFVILHIPGWSALTDMHHYNNKTVQNLIQPLLENYNGSAVIGGHNYFYARAVINGIQHITTGGGGAELHSPDPSMENIVKVEKTHHYCKIEIDGNSLKFEAVKPDGTVIDNFAIRK
jgi:hypothetical protein